MIEWNFNIKFNVRSLNSNQVDFLTICKKNININLLHFDIPRNHYECTKVKNSQNSYLNFI